MHDPSLQKDIDQTSICGSKEGGQKWLMKFNFDNHVVMHFGKSNQGKVLQSN